MVRNAQYYTSRADALFLNSTVGVLFYATNLEIQIPDTTGTGNESRLRSNYRQHQPACCSFSRL